MNTVTSSIIQFELPATLSCPLPSEERNISRDAVRLLVSHEDGKMEHSTFDQLPFFLKKEDVLVVNTSATVPSAFPIQLPDGNTGRLHVSTKLQTGEWLIEIRKIIGNKTKRWYDGKEEMLFSLQGGGKVLLKEQFYKDDTPLRLWKAKFVCQDQTVNYPKNIALPIQYENLDRHYPLSYYQTYFSFQPGSAEMPSAGRGFTKSLVKRLLRKGITIVPLLLHTGISSLEENELPYPEYLEIDPLSASILNHAKANGQRIIAAGTTVIRALETTAGENNVIKPYRGYTDLFIHPGYEMKIANGLLTGFHEPNASHLSMLHAIAGYDHIHRAYMTAIKAKYFWHQFGDLHLILP
ncbi:S-adenosylmethionine:tRNA ribosyltransferase-isomerase [soil metagenome]